MKLFAAIASLFLLPSLQSGEVIETSPAKDVLEESGPELAIFAFAAWDSRYAAEGRDMLSGEGLSSFTLEAEYGGFLFGAWLANSKGADYQEQNYFVEYGFDLFGLEAYVSYTHLRFQSDHAEDNEIGASLAAPDLLFGLTPSLDWYYSLSAEGSFFEASLGKEFLVCDQLILAPALVFGFNDGYIADGHSGANHLALQLAAVYQIAENVALEAYIAQTLAIDPDSTNFADDAQLKDFFYGGVGISVSF